MKRGTAGNILIVSLILLSWVWLTGTLLDTTPASTPIVFHRGRTTIARPSDLKRSPAQPDIRLLFAGDVMQHYAQRNDDFDRSYEGIKALVSRADLAVANLEFPVDPRQPIGPGIHSVRFNGSTAHLRALMQAGFDVVVTANNHCFDEGRAGFNRTIAEVTAAYLLPVGTAPTREALERPQIVQLGAIKIALVAYTYTINPIYTAPGEPLFPPRDLPVHMVNFAQWDTIGRAAGVVMFRDHVQRARQDGADFVIAICHWGREWDFVPTENQRSAAHDLVDAGFDVVVGSHGHVLQGSEVYHDRLISYSLGNLISDFRPWQTRTAALLEIRISTHPTPHVVDFCYYPTFVELDEHRVTLLADNDLHASEARELAKSILGPATTSFALDQTD